MAGLLTSVLSKAVVRWFGEVLRGVHSGARAPGHRRCSRSCMLGSPSEKPAGTHGLVSGSALSVLQTKNNRIWNILNKSNLRCAGCPEGNKWTLVEDSRGLTLEQALAGDKPAALGGPEA